MKNSTKAVLVAICGSIALAGVSAQTLPSSSFTTLGTNSGPIPNPRRGESANLLRADGQLILVDAGDGAAWQLGKSNVELGSINTIFISHLHFDHTGGLFAVLGQRFQTLNSTPVTIYGPRGTKAVVAGLITALTASVEGAMNMRARMPGAPGDNIKVVELDDGATFALGQIRVTAASNSHFSATPGSEATKRATLSFRFDTPGRTIVYTGDTGPSAAVEKLAKDADLLVSEIMDPDEAIARRRKQTTDRPEAVWKMISEHFHKEHLSPTEVGLLASRANVKRLVLTHNALPPELIDRARLQIQANFKGPITFAEDLNSF